MCFHQMTALFDILFNPKKCKSLNVVRDDIAMAFKKFVDPRFKYLLQPSHKISLLRIVQSRDILLDTIKTEDFCY